MFALRRAYNSSRRFMSSTNNLVQTDVRNNIGYITLTDPSKMNALTEAMGNEFTTAVDKMCEEARQQRIRACIITGQGKAFSAGGDLDWLRERHDTAPYLNKQIMFKFYNLYLCVRRIPVPTIAAINGPAIGAGMCMTLGCDYRIASEKARLGFTFVKLGIHPGMGASVLLPRLIPSQLASYYLATGRTVSGTEAAKDGLVLRAVPENEVMSASEALAEELQSGSPIAVLTLLQSLRADKFRGLDDGLMREADAQTQAYTSQDFLKGLESVRQKTVASFSGWEAQGINVTPK